VCRRNGTQEVCDGLRQARRIGFLEGHECGLHGYCVFSRGWRYKDAVVVSQNNRDCEQLRGPVSSSAHLSVECPLHEILCVLLVL
jgi:hypothetical protein